MILTLETEICGSSEEIPSSNPEFRLIIIQASILLAQKEQTPLR
jgi:hypothetical protein